VEFPSRVVSVDAAGATVDQEGRLRRASTLLVPDITPGEWVYVAAGTILDRIRPDEAQLIRSTLNAAIAAGVAEPAVTAPCHAPTGGSR
jgi:hydrogenase maturation factor